MKRWPMVLIRPSIRARNWPSSPSRTFCLPSYFPDHLLLPVTVQQKSSAMLSTSGRELPWASSSKILCTICLFSTALIIPSHSETEKHKRALRIEAMGPWFCLRQGQETLLAQYLKTCQTNFVHRDARDFDITQQEFSCDLLNGQAVFTKIQQFG